MSGHSPEPWKYSTDMDGRVNIFVDDGRVVTLCHSYLRHEDVRRIVACVNACEGLTTDFLETPDLAFAPAHTAAKMAEIEQQRDQMARLCEFNERTAKDLLAQRDQLLAALNLIEVDKDGDGFICREAMEQVRAAIAAVEGAK